MSSTTVRRMRRAAGRPIADLHECRPSIGLQVQPTGRAPAADSCSRGEFWRKLLHIAPGFLAFLLPFVPHATPLGMQSLLELTAITALLTGIYIAARRFVARPGESDFLLTALSYPAAVLATLFVFPQAPELAAVVVVVLAFGDGSAYIAGKRIGGPSLPWNVKKTWAGTIAFIAVAGPLATIAYLGATDPATPWLAGLACGVGAALVAAVAESLPTRLTDNIRVGVAAAVTAATLHFGMARWWA